MGTLIYLITASLDGYINDEQGSIDWTVPDDEVHTFVNDRLRGVGTLLMGRRMYEVMCVWDTMDLREQKAAMADFAGIWQAADKVVYSRWLHGVDTARTRLERDFDVDAVRRLKATTQRDLTIGGPTLAATAMSASLIDEWHLFVVPIAVGSGTRLIPDGIHAEFELLDERRFRSGVV